LLVEPSPVINIVEKRFFNLNRPISRGEILVVISNHDDRSSLSHSKVFPSPVALLLNYQDVPPNLRSYDVLVGL